MGRAVKRVPLDFAEQHPINEIWPGYTRDCGNDECDECPDCVSHEPPEGPGYQLWETVSEGSPISPVFADREAFRAYVMAKEDCTAAAAEGFIEDGYAPTMIMVGGRMLSGVQAAEKKLPEGTRVRHRDHGVEGAVFGSLPWPGFHCVRWDSEIETDQGPTRETASKTEALIIVGGAP